jgi:3-hydroxybutyryl-CoA dehydratase
MIRVGQIVVREFTVDHEAMRVFRHLSQDTSRIHCDRAFAQARGFRDEIVYGGIMLAQLSGALGTQLPGTNGTSTKWTINYRGPLYVGERAKLTLKVENISEATCIVDLKFRIEAGDRLVAAGTAQSIVPQEDLVIAS